MADAAAGDADLDVRGLESLVWKKDGFLSGERDGDCGGEGLAEPAALSEALVASRAGVSDPSVPSVCVGRAFSSVATRRDCGADVFPEPNFNIVSLPLGHPLSADQ